MNPLLRYETTTLPTLKIEDFIFRAQPPLSARASTKNVKRCLRRKLPRFFGDLIPQGPFEWKEHPIALLGSGPTLAKTIETAKQFKTTMVLGTCHDYAIDHGLIPDYVAILDPMPMYLDRMCKRQDKTIYLIASHCDPQYFEHFKNNQVYVWHALSDVPDRIFKDQPAIDGGGTVVMRAINLAFYLGFWDLHFFGVDGCFSADTHIWGQFQEEIIYDIILPNGRVFKTENCFVSMTEQFMQLFSRRRDIMRATIHGDNLLAELARLDNYQAGVVVCATS